VKGESRKPNLFGFYAIFYKDTTIIDIVSGAFNLL